MSWKCQGWVSGNDSSEAFQNRLPRAEGTRPSWQLKNYLGIALRSTIWLLGCPVLTDRSWTKLTLWASFQLRIFSDSIINICLCYLVLNRSYLHVYCSSSRNSVENWITEITVCCIYCSLNKRGENQSRAEKSNFSRESIAQILNKTNSLSVTTTQIS